MAGQIKRTSGAASVKGWLRRWQGVHTLYPRLLQPRENVFQQRFVRDWEERFGAWLVPVIAGQRQQSGVW
jgi:hypothetical protein